MTPKDEVVKEASRASLKGNRIGKSGEIVTLKLGDVLPHNGYNQQQSVVTRTRVDKEIIYYYCLVWKHDR